MRAKEVGGRKEKKKAKRDKKEKVKLKPMAADYQKVNQKAKVRVKNYPKPEKATNIVPIAKLPRTTLTSVGIKHVESDTTPFMTMVSGMKKATTGTTTTIGTQPMTLTVD